MVCIIGLPSARSTAIAENRDASVERITQDLNFLASDELEGRGLETNGNQRAAEYVRTALEQAGLKGGLPDKSWFQPFEVSLGQDLIAEKTFLQLQDPTGNHVSLEAGADFEVLFLGAPGTANAEIVFAGYGISAPDLKYDDFANIDVNGKIVLILRKEPQQNNPHSSFDGTETTPHAYMRTKLKAAADHGAAAVLLVNDPLTVETDKKDELAKPSSFGSGTARVPFAQITVATVNRMLTASPLKVGDKTLTTLADVQNQIDEKLTPLSQPMKGWSADLSFSFSERKKLVNNVVAVLPGQGPNSEEYVVVGAHFDHIGYGETGSRKPSVKEIHNGADDNASGTSALLEIARRMAAGPAPPRTVVFIAFNGEERGLLGSAYYVEHPTVPLKQVVAMLNFDMVGRVGENPLTAYGTGSAKEFPSLIEEVQKDHAVQVKPVSGVLGASDHYSFFLKKIPVFHFFTGLTKEYHTPEDDVETLNIAGIEQTVDFTTDMLGRILAAPAPSYVAAPTESPSRGDMAYLGVVPDYSGMGSGLKLNGVSEGSPAEKGGLKADDVMTQFGEIPIADIQGLADGLRRYKPGDIVKVTIQRDGKETQVDVKLEAGKKTPR